MSNTVKSYDGTRDVDIKNYQESLRHWPAGIRQMMSDDGDVGLTDVCYATTKCGCEIIGCGTLQFPLSIKFCARHARLGL